jgi:outer membrane protein assembly factor BamE (lipoprotein component of BamABCDE complex)
MNKILILLILLLFFLKGFSQDTYSFEKTKWVSDITDSLTTSYRGKVTNSPHFFEMLKGRTKKQMINILGKPDAINKKSFTTKGRMGYVYCINKATIDVRCKKKWNNCNPCKMSSVTIILTNGVVDDIIGVDASG